MIARQTNPDDLVPANGKRLGTSAVQFGIVAPTFFLFVLGLVEVGRGVMVTYQLTSAARDGARHGVLPGKATSDIQTAVTNSAGGQGLGSVTTTVKVNGAVADASTANSGDEISVSVSVPVSQVTWLPGGTHLSGNLSGQWTLRRE